jgi:hypothetical protein
MIRGIAFDDKTNIDWKLPENITTITKDRNQVAFLNTQCIDDNISLYE